MSVDSPKKPIVSPTKNIMVKKAEVESEAPPPKKGSLIDFFKKKPKAEPKPEEPKKEEPILQEKEPDESSQDLTQRRPKARAIIDDSD
jgi:hypothetical protein